MHPPSQSNYLSIVGEVSSSSGVLFLLVHAGSLHKRTMRVSLQPFFVFAHQQVRRLAPSNKVVIVPDNVLAHCNVQSSQTQGYRHNQTKTSLLEMKILLPVRSSRTNLVRVLERLEGAYSHAHAREAQRISLVRWVYSRMWVDTSFSDWQIFVFEHSVVDKKRERIKRNVVPLARSLSYFCVTHSH